MAPFEHSNPGFLEEVFRQLTISREVHQIPKQPVLELLDQTVEQFGVAPAQARAITLASDSIPFVN